MNIEEIVINAADRKASDIHIVCGQPIKLRVYGELVDLDDNIMSHEDCDELGYALAGDNFKSIADSGEIDFARSIG